MSNINIENLVSELQRREAAVETAEKALAEAKKELRLLEEDVIPSVLDEAGMSAVTLADGRVLKIVNDVHASILKDDRPAAFAWLREHNYGDIIKNKFSVTFGAGESPERLVEAAVELGLTPALDESIHPSTYKALCKELVFGNHQQEVPEILGIFVRRVAQIK